MYQEPSKSQEKQQHHSSAPDLVSDNTGKKSFVASTLFKQRLTDKDVLPKKQITYISHPMKMLVINRD